MARPSSKRYSKRPADAKSEEIKRKVIESQTKKRNETARRQEVSQVKDTQEIVAREDEQRVIRKDEPVVVSNENEVVSKDIIFQQDVPRDELGVQEESDEYKTREKLEVPDWAEGNVLGDIIRGTASFATGVYAPTQQITQMPVDIARGVKAEDQTMMPTWLDLLISPVMQVGVMQKELGFSDLNWYSPLGQVELWNQNKSLPAFAQGSGDKRDFLQGMGDNLNILGATLLNPKFSQYVNEGLEFQDGTKIAGYQQLITNEDSELRRNIPYYAGTVVGDIPYWVIAPMKAASAVSLAAKVSASTVRIAGKSTLSIKNINSVSKLGNAAVKVVKETRQNAKAKIDDPLRTTATDKAMKEIENNYDIRIKNKQVIVDKLEKELKGTEQRINPQNIAEASVTAKQDDLLRQIDVLKKEKETNRTLYDSNVEEVQAARNKYLGSKTETNEVDFANKRTAYTEYVRNTFNPKLRDMYNQQKGKIVDEYDNVRGEQIASDQSKLRELKRTRDLLKDVADPDSKKLAATETKITNMEAKMKDPNYMPKSYQLANMIEKAPSEVHSWVKRKINPRYSVGADELD